jgi:CRP-like cAMP-binding protein
MSRGEDLATRLAEVPLFAGCTKRDLKIVGRHAESVTVAPGTVIVEQGAPGDAMFMVLDGRAVVEKDGAPIGTIGPGAHFGELALLDPAPRNATVRAETEVTTAVIGKRVLAALLRDVPEMNLKLLASLARVARDSGAHDLLTP